MPTKTQRITARILAGVMFLLLPLVAYAVNRDSYLQTLREIVAGWFETLKTGNMA